MKLNVFNKAAKTNLTLCCLSFNKLLCFKEEHQLRISSFMQR